MGYRVRVGFGDVESGTRVYMQVEFPGFGSRV